MAFVSLNHSRNLRGNLFKAGWFSVAYIVVFDLGNMNSKANISRELLFFVSPFFPTLILLAALFFSSVLELITLVFNFLL